MSRLDCCSCRDCVASLSTGWAASFGVARAPMPDTKPPRRCDFRRSSRALFCCSLLVFREVASACRVHCLSIFCRRGCRGLPSCCRLLDNSSAHVPDVGDFPSCARCARLVAYCRARAVESPSPARWHRTSWLPTCVLVMSSLVACGVIRGLVVFLHVARRCRGCYDGGIAVSSDRHRIRFRAS